MTYKKLPEVACANKAEFFCRLRDFLCKRNGTYDYSVDGVGWVLHDSFYAVDENHPQASDYFILHSTGESGKEQLYYKVLWNGTSYIDVFMYLYWNNSTHVGVLPTTTVNLWIVNTANPLMNLIIYADLNKIFALCKFSTGVSTGNYQGFTFGKFPPILGEDDVVVRSASNLTAGSGVSITLIEDIPTSWKVGQKIFIWDQVYAKVITILTIDAGTKTITADLAQSYTGTISLSHTNSYSVQASYNPIQARNFLIGDNNTNNWYCGAAYANTSIASTINPSILNNEFGLLDYFWCASQQIKGISGIFKNIANAGSIDGDVFVDREGNYYTKYTCNNGAYIVILEP